MEILLAPAKKSTQLFGILFLLCMLFSLVIFGGKGLMTLYGVKELSANVLYISRIIFWLPLLIIFLYARKVEMQKLLIWEEKKFKFWEYLVSFIAIFFVLFVGLAVIVLLLVKLGFERESGKMVQMLALFRQNTFLIFLTAGTAGVVEELTFRGYILPRLERIFNNPLIAILLSSLLFGLLHFSFGTVIQVAGPFFIGAVFALYYYKFRNIKILIICHFLWDVMAIYLQLLAQDLKAGGKI